MYIGTSVFTDGSKMESGVGAGVFSKSASISVSFKLPETSSVFQAEDLRDPAGMQNASRSLLGEETLIFFPLAKLRSRQLSSPYCNSLLVNSCRRNSNISIEQEHISLIWVPGHRNIEGMKLPTSLPGRGDRPVSAVPSQTSVSRCPLLKGKLQNFFLGKAQNR